MPYNPNTGEGTLPTSTPAANSSDGGGGWGWIGDLLGGVNGTLGGGNNAVTLALVAGLMKMLQGQMDKSQVSPSEALGASENLRQFYTDRRNETGVPQGATNDALAAVTQRSNLPPIRPTVTAPTAQPTRFNPYASGGGVDGASTDTISKLRGIVNGPQASNQQWGMNQAVNSLANRGGVRQMAQDGKAGALNPQPLPTGFTSTNYPKLQPGNVPLQSGTQSFTDTYNVTPEGVPPELQADMAIFQKGASTPGFLGAFTRLGQYFSKGKLPAAQVAPAPAAPSAPRANTLPKYVSLLSGADRMKAGY